MGTKSNQERAKEITQLIRNWIAERDALGDSSKWIQTSGPTAFKGVKRKKLADTLIVSKTALNENEAGAELRNAEYRWSREYSQQQAIPKSANAALGGARNGERRTKKFVNSLEYDASALKAENRLLRARLRKWECVEQVLLETARAPRRVFEDR